MRTGFLGVALCAGLVFGACATTAPARPPRAAARLSNAEIAAASGCAEWRWIGIAESFAGGCPTPRPGWTATPLFQPEGNGKSDGYEQRQDGYGHERPALQPTPPERGPRPADVAEELDRFCVYETTSSRKPSRPPFESAKAAGFSRLDRDCAGISPAAANDLTAAGVEQLSKHFLAQAGMAEEMQIANKQGVRLAFLDTHPTGEVVPREPGSSKHGYTLAHIANRLVCDSQSPAACAAQITTRLVMPMLHFDRSRRVPDPDRGGGFGTQGDLAKAILAEVDDWQVDNRERPEAQRLILNLSLGWDPQLLGGLSEQSIAAMRAGSQAVYRALQYAKSLDVLVLAAAGNRRDCCPQTTGPLLPAAWEERHPSDESFPEIAKTALLYAVGGVRSDGRPLANAREAAMPTRVAYGENAVVAARGRSGVTSTWLYTGSSVATAVVSAAAALVWDTVPTLTSDQVMEDLHEGGTPLPFPADFWFRGAATPSASTPPAVQAAADALSAPDARQISVCAVLLKACQTHSASCPVSACAKTERRRAAFPAWAAQPLSTSCHPWLVPQPEDPLCPPCNPPYNP
jgi:hypothetical protein